MKIVELLAQVPLFRGLTWPQLEDLAMVLTDQTIGGGQIIFSEGDAGVGFFVVVEGRVKIFKLSPDGKEQILHVLDHGEPFAEAAVFAGVSYPAHAMTMVKSRLFFFPRQSFIDLIRQNPSLAMNMMAAMSMRLKKFTSMIEALSLKEVPGRLAAHFLYLHEEQQPSAIINLGLAKNHLASLLGTIPETISRIFKRMNRQGLIESSGREVRILNHEALQDLASGDRRL